MWVRIMFVEDEVNEFSLFTLILSTNTMEEIKIL